MEEIESYQSLDADLDYPAILIAAAGGGGQGEKGSGTGGREGGGEECRRRWCGAPAAVCSVVVRKRESILPCIVYSSSEMCNADK